MKRSNNNASKRKRYTLEDKNQIIQFRNTNPSVSYRDMSTKFNIPVGVISGILKNEEYFKNCQNDVEKKKRKLTKTETIDGVLFQWFNKKRRNNFIISDDIIKNMASKLAILAKIENFKASNGWLSSFKKRYNIKSIKISGEEGCVDNQYIKDFHSLFIEKLSMYDKADIINCDETGLFFKLAPSKTLILSDNDKASAKYSKERVTVLFFVGMDGKKYDPIVIGKFKNPHGLKYLNLKKLKIKYMWNKKAWMSLEIFNNILMEMNDLFRQENRKVLLLLDNAPVHPVTGDYSNIELFHFPPNTTSRIQPLDQGIIFSFKSNYKKILNRKIFFEHDDENVQYHDLLKKVKLVDSLLLINEAWNMVTGETIINCFTKAQKNILESNMTAAVVDENNFDVYDPILDKEDIFEDENKYLESFKMLHNALENENSNDESENEEPSERILNSCEAFAYAEQLEKFLAEKCPEVINHIYILKEMILKERKTRLATLDDYLKRKHIS